MLTSNDYEDIRNLYGRYSVAADSGDRDAYVACFAPDARIHYDGLPEGIGRNGDHVGHSILRTVAADAYSASQGHILHMIHLQTIRGAADRADVVFYGYGVRRGAAPHPEVLHTAIGRDTLSRVGDRWVYQTRFAHIDTHDATPTPTDRSVLSLDRFVTTVLNR